MKSIFPSKIISKYTKNININGVNKLNKYIFLIIKDCISSLCCSPNGKYLISGSWDKNIIVWKILKSSTDKDNLINLQKLQILIGHVGN